MVKMGALYNSNLYRFKQIFKKGGVRLFRSLQLRTMALNRYINLKQKEITNISEKIKNKDSNENDRILVIISCHTEDKLRFAAIETIMNGLKEVDDIDILMVNSTNLHLSPVIKNMYKTQYIKYCEIPNDQNYGFSKWYYGLSQLNYMDYKFVTFVNDSIFTHSSIKPFFDYTRFANVDLCGYNDSSQVTPHYQSYFFSIKSTAIDQFKKMVNENKPFVKSYMDAVFRYELNLFNYFPNRDCFLKISHFPSQRSKNIFFENDFCYFKLRDTGLLPFTKLRRVRT